MVGRSGQLRAMQLPAALNDLLKEVSRSFYLSLRFLPAEVRGYVSVAYLLARAADSIADHESVGSVGERRDLLTAWPMKREEDFLQRVAALRVDHAGEQRLLQRLGEVFAALEQGAPEGRGLIQKVLGHILEGQQQDLVKFPGELASAAELEQYTFLVAGCVGEFWSDILAWRVPGWADASHEEMRSLGRTYGQGLQLVNILRDTEEDAARGRCYLPEPGTMEERKAHWSAVARQWLQAGERYVAHLQGWRLRLTADLPWQLGLATLDKLEASEGRIKVSRSQVRQILFRSAWQQWWR